MAQKIKTIWDGEEVRIWEIGSEYPLEGIFIGAIRQHGDILYLLALEWKGRSYIEYLFKESVTKVVVKIDHESTSVGATVRAIEAVQ